MTTDKNSSLCIIATALCFEDNTGILFCMSGLNIAQDMDQGNMVQVQNIFSIA